MIKYYLVIEKGLLEERVFPLEDQLTIGRRPDNDIYLTDPQVSRQHALVSLSNQQVFAEDLGSHNGTLVNGRRIKKTVLSHGDTLQIGNVTFRFIQEQSGSNDLELLETQDLPASETTTLREKPRVSRRTRRLIEALSKVPLFSGFDDRALAQIIQSAHLVVFDRGQTIVNMGDRGKSLYIILDGAVRILAYDQQGKELLLARLVESQFFGEIAFLTGYPQNATVKAIEETLLFELSYDALKDSFRKWPAIKARLEQYYRRRLKDISDKKRETGLIERRKDPRFNEKLPVSFSVSPTCAVSGHFRGRVFHSLSQDLSVSGMRIRVQDTILHGLPMGCQLRMEITLPQPWGSVRCLGTLRNTIQGREGQSSGYLGVEFVELPFDQRRKLERFLFGAPSASM
jgi:pSer/pThr/pTyr-binding forkhead associated (FHA) protein